ncbi:uncharacterized protein ZBIST_1018 [Zygosaccharomyces bailii]|nr:uncharacterized protein ZBIST_1018 [Zygosaccharomyces bailii]
MLRATFIPFSSGSRLVITRKRFYSGNSKNGDNKAIMNVSNTQRHTKARLLVPRVPSTDYITAPEIQTEGLFAGYRPLFLGNSPIGEKRSSGPLDNFFTSFANLKLTEDSERVGEVNVQEVIEDLKRDVPSKYMSNSRGRNRKPIIPWDASISGMVYNDEPFKHVPNNVVSKLKPFKIVRIERKSEPKNPRPDMVRMKVHNSKVNDEPEMINIFNAHAKRRKSNGSVWNEGGSLTGDTYETARRKYDREINHFNDKHKFIRSDQRVTKQDIDKLNRLLVKELHKLTNLAVSTDFREMPLPLCIYVDKSIYAKQSLRRTIKKRILDHIQPALSMTLSAYGTEESAKRFERKMHARIKNTVRDLCECLPSAYFTREAVDCVVGLSPVQGFKRMHWLKPRKRNNVFRGKNFDMDYMFTLDGTFNVTRSGVKYMRYPVTLNCTSFDKVFSEWDYIA